MRVYSGALCLRAGGVAGLLSCSCTPRPLGGDEERTGRRASRLGAAEEVSDAKRVSAELADASKATLSVWNSGL